MSSSGTVVSPTVVRAAVAEQLPGVLDATVVRQDELGPLLDPVYVARDSIYLRDFVSDAKTPTENRAGYVAAIDAAAAGPKRLCYDGAFFSFEGAEVTSTATDMVHWASSLDTHRVVSLTKGRGALVLAGERSVASRLRVDGANPTLDLSGVTIGGAGQFRYSVGIRIAPGGHRSEIRDVRCAGFMHAIVVGSISPESLTGAAPLPAPDAQLRDCVVDGVYNDGCWTALQHIAVMGLTVRRLRGWWQDVTGSGGEGHQIYGGGYFGGGLDWWCERVTIEDCETTSGEAHGQTDSAAAYKLARHRDLSISNMVARNSPGLIFLETCEDFVIGPGCESWNDVGGGIGPLFQLTDCKNGRVASIRVNSVGQPAAGWAPMMILRCTDVQIDRPHITVNPPAAVAAVSLLNVRGTCTGTTITAPTLINKSAHTLAGGVLVSEASGEPGTSSGVTITDPDVRGLFLNGARVAIKGATLRIDPEKIAAPTKTSVDPGFAVTIENRRAPLTPYRQPRTLGWHNGEVLAAGSARSRTWPSGQQSVYTLGNEWTGDDRGRIMTGTSGGSRMMAATFPVADVELSASVLLGAGSTRAGFCLRANSANDYLIVARVPGGVVIAKRVVNAVTVLASATTTIPDGVFGTLRAVIVGSSITAHLDGLTQPLRHTLASGDETTFASSTAHGFHGDVAAAAIWENTLARSVS